MKQPVVIKANNYGLMIILDPDLEFEELLKAVGEKFKESAKFFGNADMAVAFDGRKLSLLGRRGKYNSDYPQKFFYPYSMHRR